MCGIAGFWEFAGGPVDTQQLARMTDSLWRRGPDGRGTHIDAKAGVALGHRRLSVLDLSERGLQPLAYIDKRYWITYNGEVYNFIELRAQLRALGQQFLTDTDTEVIVAAYHQWGEDCQLRFNGMWAFAIWDAQEQTLFLSRDRFGIKPLFYINQPSRFAFASEAKAFLALEWFEPSFDVRAIGQAIGGAHQLDAGDASIWKGVNRLQAGHSLHLRRGHSPKITRWWNTLDHLESAPNNWDEQVERFKYLFADACRIRTRSDVPVATSLSGGLDSSAVACMLRKLNESSSDLERMRSVQRAFVATFDGTAQDEKKYAQAVIEFTGAKPTYIPVDFAAGLKDLENILYQFEEIYDLAIVGPWLVYQAFRENGVPVSIDGHGGDELLAGYHHYPMIEFEHISRSPRQIKRMIQCQRILSEMYPAGASNRRAVSPLNAMVKRFTPSVAHRFQKIWQRNRGAKAGPVEMPRVNWLSEPVESSHVPGFISDMKNLNPHDVLNQALYYDFHYGTLPTILRNFDRLSMAHGIEVRAPFMDWRLVTYTFSLPSHTKLNSRWTKALLRDSMAGLMPESIRTRMDKVGFTSPMIDWLGKGPLRETMMDVISSRSSVESDLWDGRALLKDVEASLTARPFRSAIAAWPYVQANLLQKLFADRKLELKRREAEVKIDCPSSP